MIQGELTMNLISGVKSLQELYTDFRSMKADEKADFYQSKCDYYQNFAAVCMLLASFFSVGYILPDYLINRTVIPTLLPRLSVIIAIVLFLIVTHYSRKRSLTVFMDHFLVHMIIISSIWAIYNLDDQIHSSEGLILMNLMLMIVGFVAKPSESLLSQVAFFLEILISDRFIHYEGLPVIIVLQATCAIGILVTECLMTLFYLDHYRIMQKLELAMVTDPLTQVYNRHLLERIITQNALKDINGPVAIAMMDIDYFKQVNDEHGHYTGDLTLLYIGQKLSKETHDNDYVIRYGGEEFVIILKNCDVNNACARMEQFRRDIESAPDTPVPITVSVGVSRYTGDFTKSIQNVDNALYKAKNTGRNKVVVV